MVGFPGSLQVRGASFILFFRSSNSSRVLEKWFLVWWENKRMMLEHGQTNLVAGPQVSNGHSQMHCQHAQNATRPLLLEWSVADWKDGIKKPQVLKLAEKLAHNGQWTDRVEHHMHGAGDTVAEEQNVLRWRVAFCSLIMKRLQENILTPEGWGTWMSYHYRVHIVCNKHINLGTGSSPVIRIIMHIKNVCKVFTCISTILLIQNHVTSPNKIKINYF